MTIQYNHHVPGSGVPQKSSFSRMLGAEHGNSGEKMRSKVQGSIIATSTTTSRATRQPFLCSLIHDTVCASITLLSFPLHLRIIFPSICPTASACLSLSHDCRARPFCCLSGGVVIGCLHSCICTFVLCTFAVKDSLSKCLRPTRTAQG